jgi:hypothetical protein
MHQIFNSRHEWGVYATFPDPYKALTVGEVKIYSF